MINRTILIFVICLLSFTFGSDEQFLENPKYMSHRELKVLFENLQEKYPNLATTRIIGKSVLGKDLLVFQVTSNVNNVTLLKPMVKFVANMHGDETVGRELVIFLSQYLLNNYDSDVEVKDLLDSVDVYLMPSLNPDGFAVSVEGACESNSNYVGRNNANGVDLNRDFPDQFDHSTIENVTRQPETLAMMSWVRKNPFILSGNLHGGALVASYPYDDTRSGYDCCHESRSPDDSVFKALALTYASKNPQMRVGNSCKPDNFTNGITNGAYWYEVRGGMQDFNYVYSNCFEVTFELSCCKYPNATDLPQYWRDNKASMLAFIRAAQWGVKGIIENCKSRSPITLALVEVQGIDHGVASTPFGEYWRLLVPGQYKLRFSAPGYETSMWFPVNVVANTTSRLDVCLSPAKEVVKCGDVRVMRTLLLLSVLIAFISVMLMFYYKVQVMKTQTQQ